MKLNKLDEYKKQIDEISSNDFNADQKKIAKEILEKFEDNEDLNKIYQFVTQRVRIGFVFDIAPEINSKAIAILKKNENMSFKFDENSSISNNLIIGENYDALKNLSFIEREREREQI